MPRQRVVSVLSRLQIEYERFITDLQVQWAWHIADNLTISCIWYKGSFTSSFISLAIKIAEICSFAQTNIWKDRAKYTWQIDVYIIISQLKSILALWSASSQFLVSLNISQIKPTSFLPSLRLFSRQIVSIKKFTFSRSNRLYAIAGAIDTCHAVAVENHWEIVENWRANCGQKTSSAALRLK